MPAVVLPQREMLTTTKMDAHKRSEVGMRNSTPEHFAHSESEQLVELQTAALKAVPTAIVITDREAKIVWVNYAFEQWTGYSSQEVVGLLRDRARGLSLAQLAKAYRISRTSVARALKRSESSVPNTHFHPLQLTPRTSSTLIDEIGGIWPLPKHAHVKIVLIGLAGYSRS